MKKRFRDVKQGKHKPTNQPGQGQDPKFPYPYASIKDKAKALLTDSFMLLMPIMYIVVYLVIGSLQAFAEERFLGWVYILVPLVIVQTLFLTFSGQTPGYRAYDLELIDMQTGRKPSFFIIVFRNLCALLSVLTLFGWVMMFFRKDRKTLHDLLSNTAVITKA